MKKWLPWALAAVFAAWFIADMRPPKKEGFDIAGFGQLPVLLNGRVQPLDSVARSALLSISGKSAVRLENAKRLSPSEWLLEAMARRDLADQRKIFRIQHPDLEGLLGAQTAKLEYYSFNDLSNQLAQIQSQMQELEKAEQGREDASRTRTPFQKDLVHVYNSLYLYQRVNNSLQPSGAKDFQQELSDFISTVGPARQAVHESDANKQAQNPALQKLAGYFRRYSDMSEQAYAMVIPPLAGETADRWMNLGASLMETARSEKIHPAVASYAAMLSAYQKNQPVEFNKALVGYRIWLQNNNLLPEMTRCSQEFAFNRLEPFYKCTVIYVAAMLLGCLFWVNLSEGWRRSGFALLALAFVFHTIGLCFRMYLEGRPPVTNLYSSAIFIGWGAVLLGLILEWIFKGGIGLVSSAFIGFVTLIIAHHLSLNGDTMEMMRAVLNSNFWLSTHVVTITVGYSSMFIAGILAIIYILRGFCTRSLTPEMGKSLARMVYGIICFSTLASFAGTVLGGIWADQSWGRFWGWDPKENGALLIVLWNAAILHARWAGIIKERGLMAMAVFGNIVTAFSWFGVNMLGVGLHSYGFMDGAFFWLALFDVTQVAIIVLALLPPKYWASFSREPVPDNSH